MQRYGSLMRLEALPNEACFWRPRALSCKPSAKCKEMACTSAFTAGARGITGNTAALRRLAGDQFTSCQVDCWCAGKLPCWQAVQQCAGPAQQQCWCAGKQCQHAQTRDMSPQCHPMPHIPKMLQPKVTRPFYCPVVIMTKGAASHRPDINAPKGSSHLAALPECLLLPYTPSVGCCK
jgi:hypothetical protein